MVNYPTTHSCFASTSHGASRHSEATGTEISQEFPAQPISTARCHGPVLPSSCRSVTGLLGEGVAGQTGAATCAACHLARRELPASAVTLRSVRWLNFVASTSCGAYPRRPQTILALQFLWEGPVDSGKMSYRAQSGSQQVKSTVSRFLSRNAAPGHPFECPIWIDSPDLPKSPIAANKWELSFDRIRAPPRIGNARWAPSILGDSPGSIRRQPRASTSSGRKPPDF